MHNQTVIMPEFFYDWQGYENINDNNDNILLIQIIVLHIMKFSTKFILT